MNTTIPDSDAGQPDSGQTSEKKDAGNPSPTNKDAGKDPVDSGKADSGATDAGQDSAVPPIVDAGPGDVAFDPGPPPETWKCASALWADGYCDCGCGATDSDCVGQSCTESGCIAVGCDACYSTELAWKPCEPAPDPSAWSCDPERRTDPLCDCGCSIADDACRGSGCGEPGCWRGACDVRHGSDGGVLDVQRPPATWKCPTAAWGGGNGCDCGCGAPDPDCQSSHNCTSPLCNEAECAVCHDKTGRTVPCDDTLASWTCDPQRFGSGDGCDCGCGTADPDCAEQGCSEWGCRADACARCTDSSYPEDQLLGCASTKTWTCHLSHYGTGDGCDCGCGIPDPDCSPDTGCSMNGCQQDGCDYCHTGSADLPQDYQVCTGWTCSSDAYTDGSCDCGCGKPDPYCRLNYQLGCTDPGCSAATCDLCSSDGSALAACEGPQWSETGTCARANYGLDGKCDCGCGAIDPDCGTGSGCAAPFCAADGCEVCHGSGLLLTACLSWNCTDEAYTDGTCDCGCGAPDPDCDGQGCSEPGCRGDMDACQKCHDPFGRVVACP